jgi:DNA-directed RNA polymerase subunit RPC12/RpoP
MPLINKYRCDRCDLTLPTGWGGNMYVTDRKGKRIVCPHPGEWRTVERVIKESYPEHSEELEGLWDMAAIVRRIRARVLAALTACPRPFDIGLFIDSRIGFNAHCLCYACLNQFKIDLKRDRRKCPSCGSRDVRSVRESVGRKCPKCREGRIREILTGLMA